ncbi:unnamed protein product [Ranitomeya imitator]|uniref:ribonuclease H n=1 Tax=Ranitomeya imitator TaxID=111125 RepID=A0ABN9LLA3_9NEOB|nr:unnamed protein product [Ranitomeya imitator]
MAAITEKGAGSGTVAGDTPTGPDPVIAAGDLERQGGALHPPRVVRPAGLVITVRRNTGPLHGSDGEVRSPTYLRNRVAWNPVHNPLSNNLKSAREFPAILHDKLDKEIRAGRFQGPFDAPPFFNLRVSPLGIVPKKEPGKYRLIHHLSYPKGRLVNDGIPDDDTAVSYIPFDRAVEMVRKAGPGALMAKSDIESAFRLLLVHPDCYHLLGAMFENKYYFDTCLPMGCSISCHYFEMFSTFLEWVARKVTGLPSITHYLDDFLFVGPANLDVCHHALAQFKDVMSCFGVPLSPEKTIGPVSVITFLGIEIDSVAMEFRLPQDKIAKLQELIAGCLAVGKVTLVQMQSLLGSLNFACKVMPMGRIFSRRLILATKGVKLPHHRIRITAQLRSDLIIWQRFLFSYNGKTCCQEDKCDSDSLGLRLDTVDAVGFSVSFRDQTCADTWPESWVTRAWTQDSVLLELFPLAAAMELWGQFLGNKRVCLRLKSDKVTHALNFLSSSSLPLIRVIAFTVLKCLENNTWLKAHALSMVNDAVGTAANPGMPAFGLGCPGELIPLLRSSIAPSTWKAYGKAWDEWCLVAAEKPVGSSDSLRLQVTLAFLARLQASGVSGAAARNRISGVAFHFKLRGSSDSTKHFLIAQVLKGWRRASACSDQRRPISFTLLSNLVRVSWSVCVSDYEATLISAAFSLAFFGAMRVSEILPSSRCRAGGLQLEDLVICDDGLRVRCADQKPTRKVGEAGFAFLPSRDRFAL